MRFKTKTNKSPNNSDHLIGVIGGNLANEQINLHVLQEKDKISALSVSKIDISDFIFLQTTPFVDGNPQMHADINIYLLLFFKSF